MFIWCIGIIVSIFKDEPKSVLRCSLFATAHFVMALIFQFVPAQD